MNHEIRILSRNNPFFFVAERCVSIMYSVDLIETHLSEVCLAWQLENFDTEDKLERVRYVRSVAAMGSDLQG